jgi:hypothetical protein
VAILRAMNRCEEGVFGIADHAHANAAESFQDAVI